jgi:hypothetical protein
MRVGDRCSYAASQSLSRHRKICLSVSAVSLAIVSSRASTHVTSATTIRPPYIMEQSHHHAAMDSLTMSTPEHTAPDTTVGLGAGVHDEGEAYPLALIQESSQDQAPAQSETQVESHSTSRL